MTKSETILLISIFLWASAAFSLSAPEGPEGIYLARGGCMYVEIVRGKTGALEVRGGLPFEKNALSARMEGGCLILQSLMWNVQPDPNDFDSIQSYYKLQPSSKTPGDWDLVRVCVGYYSERYKAPNPASLPPLPHPPESFLRRLDDPRVAQYFQERKKIPTPVLGKTRFKAPPEADLMMMLASGLLTAHPNDLAIKVVYLDALTHAHAASELEMRLEKWREEFKAHGTPLQQRVFQRAEEWVKANQLSVKGLNARDFLARILSDQTSLADRIELFPRLMRYSHFGEPRMAIPRRGMDNSINSSNNSHANCQVLRVISIFLMLQGKREEALRLLIAIYHNGWLFEQDGYYGALLTGGAFRRYSLNEFELYAMNYCETSGELLDFIKALDSLKPSPSKYAKAQEDRRDDVWEPEQAGVSPPYTTYFEVSLVVASARLQALRAAAGVRCYYLQNKQFPNDLGALSTFWKSPPMDPFSDLPIKFIRQSDQCICYSDGPDRKDNAGAVEFDPTNGSPSVGDITVRIPAARKYPFPREGVMGATADDLRRIFPNGLPPDPFSWNKHLPLGIAGSNPACIFSPGPDDNGPEIRAQGAAYKPGPQYDPTNGLTSKGDLFLSLGR